MNQQLGLQIKKWFTAYMGITTETGCKMLQRMNHTQTSSISIDLC